MNIQVPLRWNQKIELRPEMAAGSNHGFLLSLKEITTACRLPEWAHSMCSETPINDHDRATHAQDEVWRTTMRRDGIDPPSILAFHFSQM